jgi:peptidoglycan/xylan/chitin deacetylase (PgdA/CDA1 family)
MRFRRGLRWIRRKLRSARPTPIILMYHRIADEPVDPWGLAVSPSHFEEQLQVVRRVRYPVPLTEFVRRLGAGTLPAHSVALTFDDGYADNFTDGKPRLAAADVPATVFLTTGYIGCPDQFWWDELAQLILRESGPQRFEVVIGNRVMHFEFGTDTDLPKRGNDPWRAWSAPLTPRQDAYLAIWQVLRPLRDAERSGVMTQLRSILSDSGPSSRPRSRAMTRDEARALATGGLVAIGAHTVTHPQLTGLGTGDRRREIAESKAACEELIGAPVLGFAYPYGDLDNDVRATVEAAGFEFACSTRSGAAVSGCDALALPRVQVLDWDGVDFENMLRSLN